MINYIFWKSNLFLIFFFITYHFHSILSIPCPVNKPFRLEDRTCGDFTETCQTNEGQCNILKEACKQCPPLNPINLMLLDIMNIVKVQSNYTEIIMNEKIGRLTVQFNSTEAMFQSRFKKLIDRTNAGLIIWVVLFILFLLFVIFLSAAIWRRKILLRRPKPTNESVPLVNVDLMENNNLIPGPSINYDTRFDIFDSRMQSLFDLCNQLILDVSDVSLKLNLLQERNQATSMTINKLEFHIVGLEKPIELGVQSNDNIVRVKHQLCSKLVNSKAHDSKRMKIKINESHADDNHYLLPLIKSPQDKIYCEIDWSIKDRDIIFLQLQGNRCLPELIQIHRSQTISNLKKIISDFNQCLNMAIYKDLKELDDKSTIDFCKFVDYDWVKVIAIESGKLSISSMFDDGPSLVLDYRNNNKLSWIHDVMAEKLGCHRDDLILTYGSSYCEDDTFLFEMNFTPGSMMGYLNSMKLDRVVFGDHLCEGDSSDLYEASEKWTKKEIVMKRYELTSIKKLKDNKSLLNDLIKLQITKTHSRFIKTLGIYHDDKYFYIAMEKIKGSLAQIFIKDSGLSKSYIPLWAKQILEGLSFLHKLDIVHGDIKPSNILLTEQNEIKLSVLGLSKYRHSQKQTHLKEGLTLAKIGTLKYMAPEISNGEPFELKADIYSFGVTLAELYSGQLLSVTGPKKNEKFNDILDKLDTTDEMKMIIRECCNQDYHNRPSAEALLKKDAFTKLKK